MIVKFLGESVWDAVVNDNCLDIVEEDSFLHFCGNCKSYSLAELEILFER